MLRPLGRSCFLGRLRGTPSSDSPSGIWILISRASAGALRNLDQGHFLPGPCIPVGEAWSPPPVQEDERAGPGRAGPALCLMTAPRRYRPSSRSIASRLFKSGMRSFRPG